MKPETYYGICNLSVVPCRKEPSDKSEQVTQLLFGDHFEILYEKGSWVQIKIAYDSYECWIDKKQYLSISKEIFENLNDAKSFYYSDELVQPITLQPANIFFPIVMGSALPFYKNNKCTIGENEFYYDGSFEKSNTNPRRDSIIETAYIYINTPYLWGGKSPFGIDCSGFTQMVYKLNGIKLPRDAYQQAELGTDLNFVEEAKPGDLAFFDNDEGKIIHTGIILTDSNIIHASGKVRIDRLDHQGIFNKDLNKYSHNLRIIKSFI